MEKTWKITLADGTKLENLGLSGNNFISKQKVTEETFDGKLSRVIFNGTDESGNDIEEIHEHMELVQIVKYGKDYYFVLRDLSEDELKNIKIQSDIEYIAMMTDVDLEEA